MAQPAKCAHCDGPLVVTIEVDDAAILDRLDRIEAQLRTIIKKENQLMTDQDRLDTDVQALGAGLDQIEAEIAALKAQPGAEALDFTGLEAVLARVQDDAAANASAPEPPAAADVPAPSDAEAAPAGDVSAETPPAE